ncbi:MAG: 3-dehydroquinate synthase [Gammaproteobacteria bacterium]|nr:3-dehydroquinate synthase [Gammaproteobacteria bacterium]
MRESVTEERRQERLAVRLADGRSYPIVLGSGLLDTDGLLDPFVGSQVLVVSNAAVAEHYLDGIRRRLSAERVVDVALIGDGERFKTLDTYASILDELIAKRHSRATTVVALGGGVVGDVAGFAAATYQRGVGLVQIPTTLLAQVDSSVGGKTAVNHATGKNLIGAFYQPRAVIADVDVLATLPEREFRAGLAEVVKYGVIADARFFAWLERSMDALLRREPAPLIAAVRRSCEIKAEVVAGDEREQGRRAILNFGHTFGHAIEAETGYDTYLHGEAVAIGMAIAASLSARLGSMPEAEVERLHDLLRRAGLPVAPSGVDAHAVLTTMGMDKKALDGRIRLVLCDGLGSVSVTAETPSGMIVDAIRDAALKA